MATVVSQSITLNTSLQARDYLDYFDIMILGKTGMGKTSTADKILMANPTHKDYQYNPTQQENGKVSDRGSSTSEDLTVWHVSDDPSELERVTLRLKNLVFWRSLENPHEEVNTGRKTHSRITERCELLSNDTSKVRVLDIPGFYGTNASSAEDVGVRANETTLCDLSTMRKILRIQTTRSFKFNRIVYFLPETGVLTRSSQILQMEISIMKKYFDHSIFESMVVVATHNQSSYRMFPKDVELYTEEDKDTTLHRFKIAMQKVFKREDVPMPDLIFISLFDSCEQVLRKIKQSRVVREGVTLTLNPYLCARCGIKIQMLEQRQRGDNLDGDDWRLYAKCIYEESNQGVPYLESTCHPLMIPKHSKVARVIGGVAHVITGRVFKGKWPDFDNQDEVCGSCHGPPNCRGCIRVGGEYHGIPVDHTTDVQENYMLEENRQ